MTIWKRIGVVVVGLLVTLIGLAAFVMMCGANTHVMGGFLGALGGAVVGVRRGARPVLWYATGGGVAMALVGTGLEFLFTGGCAGFVFAVLAGCTLGLGIGTVTDAVRPAPRVMPTVPDPE